MSGPIESLPQPPWRTLLLHLPILTPNLGETPKNHPES